MSLVTINWMVQKIIEIHGRSMKRRVAGKRRDDEQCLQPVNFRTTKFHRLGKFFTTWEILRQIFAPPALKHLQKNKTKNYEKINLKNKEIYKI